MEVFYRNYLHEVGYKIGDTVFALPDGSVIQEISFDTKVGPKSLEKFKLKDREDEGEQN